MHFILAALFIVLIVNVVREEIRKDKLRVQQKQEAKRIRRENGNSHWWEDI